MYEKATGSASVACKLSRAGSLGIIWVDKTVLIRLIEIQSGCTPAGCEGKDQQKNNDLYQNFCLGESCPASLGPEARQFSSSSHVLGTSEAAAPMLELRV